MLNALIYIEATSSNRNEIYPNQQHILVLDYYACDSFRDCSLTRAIFLTLLTQSSEDVLSRLYALLMALIWMAE